MFHHGNLKGYMPKLSPTASDNSFTPVLNYYGTKTRVKFAGSCLQHPKLSFTHGKAVNIYNVYELGPSSSYDNDSSTIMILALR